MLTIETKLTAKDQAPVKTALLLEIELFKERELLPYAEDGLAVLESADSEGCTEVSETQLFGLAGSFAKVVCKACFTAFAPFPLFFQAGDTL